MGVDLAELLAIVDMPDFEEAAATAGKEAVTTRHEGQTADPVFVRVVD